MLSSIHPFGERARQQRYWVTASWFMLGSFIGGAVLGIVQAALALAVGAAGLANDVLALLVVAAAVVWDATGWPVPSISRQVDEAWLDRYRGWVYGLGYGVQLGVGYAVYVKTALIYGMTLAVVLTGRPVLAFWTAVVFGAGRGSLILLTARVDGPTRLRHLFGRVSATAGPTRRVADASLVVLLVLAVLA